VESGRPAEAMRAALWEEWQGGPRVHCFLCAHHCRIAPGDLGRCGVRENRDGVLYTLVYGRPISTAVDPIEKKPLFHFLPGSMSFSLATVGCNFTCSFCQNADISQMPRDRGRILGRQLPPEQAVSAALEAGCLSISYTYTEPTIFYEYARDCARLATAAGLKNVFVTNGYMTAETLDDIDGHLHAANVDLKSFSDQFYRTLVGARLKPVLDSIRRLYDMGVWLEITTLLIFWRRYRPIFLGTCRASTPPIACATRRPPPWRWSRRPCASGARRACATSTEGTSPATLRSRPPVPRAGRS
jgi:pyruvate formate lyase activating enzyme